MKRQRKRGYTISAVAAMFNVHPQTLRLYEREGLLKPSRSQGNTRFYLDKDLERLEVILNLTRDLKVNLAGVEVILNMRERMEALQHSFSELFRYVQLHMEREEAAFQEELRHALVPVPPTKIVRVRPFTD
ncbi:MAG: helix-turn-helix transcriptional regulator [Acidobacteria bacterium]|nr:helix-turn-helix transcriptional regulator [Acidobacteriota bacterium]